VLAAYRVPGRASGLGFAVNEAARSVNGFGDVPNDFEAGMDLCYTPVRQGWVYGRPVQTGLGQDPATAAIVAATTPNGREALKSVVRTQRMQVTLQVFSTLAVVTLAGLGAWQALRERKRGY
jgi:hypothetical protein